MEEKEIDRMIQKAKRILADTERYLARPRKTKLTDTKHLEDLREKLAALIEKGETLRKSK